MRRTAVKSANDQPEGRPGEAGDRRSKLTRLMRIVALPLLLCSAAVLSCSNFLNDEYAPWNSIQKFDLQYQMQDEGTKLGLTWTYGANNDYIKSNQMLSKEKTGLVTYTLDKKALACNAVTPSTNFVVRIGYDDSKSGSGRGSVGTIESNPLSIPSVVTPTLKLYGNRDQTRANGFKFNTSDWSASGITYAERQGAGAWFVVVDSGGKLYLTSAHLVANSEWGVRENLVAVAAVDFDDLATCPSTADPSWSLKSELEVGKTYGLWQGQFGGWNITDQFAKATVMAIDSNEVTLKLAVQPKSGLRWIITN
jgi:hypothetical protein